MSEENHILPVTYRGQELEFPLQILQTGYTLKFVVTIGEAKMIFEKDDQGEYRAILAEAETYKGKMPEQGLLAAIHEVLQSLDS